MKRDQVWPLVTIGIPLYRAGPFVERIARHIETLDYPNLEFVLADQHGLDNALELLKAQFADDPRVRFHASRDELDWVQNYNFVLGKATGKYFRMLSQDDVIPPGTLGPAVTCFESHPEVVLVDGPVDLIDGYGDILHRDDRGAYEARRPPRWPLLDSLTLLAGWRHEETSLALVRRSVVVEHGLRLPHTYGLSGLSFRACLFAVSLRGSIRTLPQYINRRCIHPESFTSRRFSRSPGRELRRLASYLRVCLRLWSESGPTAAERLVVPPMLVFGVLAALPARRAWQLLTSPSAHHRRIASRRK